MRVGRRLLLSVAPEEAVDAALGHTARVAGNGMSSRDVGRDVGHIAYLHTVLAGVVVHPAGPRTSSGTSNAWDVTHRDFIRPDGPGWAEMLERGVEAILLNDPRPAGLVHELYVLESAVTDGRLRWGRAVIAEYFTPANNEMFTPPLPPPPAPPDEVEKGRR